MNAATATVIVILSTLLTLATIKAYEQLLADERERADRATDHAEQCQALLSQARHPSLRVVDHEREPLDPRLARHLHIAEAAE